MNMYKTTASSGQLRTEEKKTGNTRKKKTSQVFCVATYLIGARDPSATLQKIHRQLHDAKLKRLKRCPIPPGQLTHAQLQQHWCVVVVVVVVVLQCSTCTAVLRAGPAKKRTMFPKSPAPPLLRVRTWHLEALTLTQHCTFTKKVYETWKKIFPDSRSRRDIRENSKALTCPH